MIWSRLLAVTTMTTTGPSNAALGFLAVALTICTILFVALFVIAMTIFWIWSVIDMMQQQQLDSTMKLVWILVLLFTGALGATLYYFMRPKTAATTTPMLSPTV
jgi:cellulose synthase/poly-beta-1,6-N-acetylglucosamine synthase-like glycosyltransferase